MQYIYLMHCTSNGYIQLIWIYLNVINKYQIQIHAAY